MKKSRLFFDRIQEIKLCKYNNTDDYYVLIVLDNGHENYLTGATNEETKDLFETFLSNWENHKAKQNGISQ